MRTDSVLFWQRLSNGMGLPKGGPCPQVFTEIATWKPAPSGVGRNGPPGTPKGTACRLDVGLPCAVPMPGAWRARAAGTSSSPARTTWSGEKESAWPKTARLRRAAAELMHHQGPSARRPRRVSSHNRMFSTHLARARLPGWVEGRGTQESRVQAHARGILPGSSRPPARPDTSSARPLRRDLHCGFSVRFRDGGARCSERRSGVPGSKTAPATGGI